MQNYLSALGLRQFDPHLQVGVNYLNVYNFQESKYLLIYTRRQINLYRVFFADFSVNSIPKMKEMKWIGL